MNPSIPAALARCDPSVRAAIVASLPERSVRVLNAHFPEWAHAGQLAPAACAGAGSGAWRTWVVMAGRGFGKTRAGAEWVMACVRGSRRGFQTPGGSSAAPQSEPNHAKARAIPEPTLTRRFAAPSPVLGNGPRKVRIALVAASLDEARRVMVEGPSGILAVAQPGEVAEWSFQRRRILFAGGAEAWLFSGAHPDGLRGPEHDFAWRDELAKWRYARDAWDNLQLGLRRGAFPRALVTTTPRRGAALKALLGEDGVVVTGGGSATNPHLPDGWVAAQAARLGSGPLRRQELDGELIDEAAGALWTRALIERCRVQGRAAADAAAPHPHPSPQGGGTRLARIVIGVDPPTGEGVCGIVAAGLGADGIAYVLADHSAGGLSPQGWAAKVAGAATAHGADAVVAEINQGGTMVKAVLEAAGLRQRVETVRAAQGKTARAAPVAALFEAGRASFAGIFPELEAELTGLCGDGRYEGPGASPDRADAMVWALTRLMRGSGAAGPSVRGLGP